jgi:methylase of polypeptide subunit release factors
MRTFLRKTLARVLNWDYINSKGYLSPAWNRVKQYRDNMHVGDRVLEIGPGSGVISRMAFEKGAKEVVAADINPAAVDATKKLVPQATVLHSDLFEKVDGRFDTIIFAAPWSEGTPTAACSHAVYEDGVVNRFFREARGYLSKDGTIWIQYCDAYPKNYERFHDSLRENGYRIEDEWSFGCWDIMVKRHAKVYLYKVRPN